MYIKMVYMMYIKMMYMMYTKMVYMMYTKMMYMLYNSMVYTICLNLKIAFFDLDNQINNFDYQDQKK